MSIPQETPRLAPERSNAPAFVVGEVLLALAVIVVLFCILMASLGRAHRLSAAWQCRNNMKQLGAAWLMYTDDNEGRVTYNHDGGGAGKSAGQESWVAGWLDFSSSPDNTNTAMLVDHKRYHFGAFLGPYLRSACVFHCPSDTSSALMAGQLTASEVFQ